MRYLADLNEGDSLSDVYLCKYKAQAETRNGKPYSPSCATLILLMEA